MTEDVEHRFSCRVVLARALLAAWLGAIAALAVLHAIHLTADFPNYSPWSSDWAKYTDEGWYGNAAIRAHLLGNWYRAGDFNPAVALPVWPALEWLVFSFTGVSIAAGRALAVCFFFASLLLAYRLVRTGAPRWAALMAVTLMAASPFLYSFGRLAILEPALVALLLAALNLAVGLPRARRPVLNAAFAGLLFALMMLTKTTAIFLLPALAWAVWMPLRQAGRSVLRPAAAAAGSAAAAYGFWLALVAACGLFPDYRYLFFINVYPKPPELTWPLASLWWSLHGALWIDRILIPLAALLAAGAAVGGLRRSAPGSADEPSAWQRSARTLAGNPVFGSAVLAGFGMIAFMTYQDHPQPRYFTVVAVFAFIAIALETAALVAGDAPGPARGARLRLVSPRALGGLVAAVVAAAALAGSVRIVHYATHPEYTFVGAAGGVVHYIDAHPNGNRLLVSVSGDEISLIAQLPALCDEFGTQELPAKLARYQPGWYAAWNDLDPESLEALHSRYSLEQVASFPAFDHPERNVLVLFKLHPLAVDATREIEAGADPRAPLAADKIGVTIE